MTISKLGSGYLAVLCQIKERLLKADQGVTSWKQKEGKEAKIQVCGEKHGFHNDSAYHVPWNTMTIHF